METNNLDLQFSNKLTFENIQKVFLDLIARKTDLLDGSIHIAKGADGIDYLTFQKNISTYSNIICTKGISGKYIFFHLEKLKFLSPRLKRINWQKLRKLIKFAFYLFQLFKIQYSKS